MGVGAIRLSIKLGCCPLLPDVDRWRSEGACLFFGSFNKKNQSCHISYKFLDSYTVGTQTCMLAFEWRTAVHDYSVVVSHTACMPLTIEYSVVVYNMHATDHL